MDVLGIAQAAADEAGLLRPATLANPSDDVGRRAAALLTKAGRNLARARNAWNGGWTALTRELSFETEAGRDEYPLPEDYQATVPGTVWDRNSYYEAVGSLSPQRWQQYKAGVLEWDGLRPRYRLRRPTLGTGSVFVIDPVPGEGERLVLEYVSTLWLRPEGGSPFGTDDRDRIGADTDVPLLDADLLEMDLLWRLKQAEGLSWAVERAEWRDQYKARMGDDTGEVQVNMAVSRRGHALGHIPRTGFGEG